MSLPREWSFQATDDDALQVDMSAVRTASSRSDGVDDNQNSLGGSLFSIHSAPVLELNTNSCRPSGLLLEGNARSVDTGLPCHTSPHDTIVDEDDNDNLLTISSLTARPLIAKSRELRSSKLKKKRKQCTDYRPDGGYGWAVVFGAFLVQFWVAGLVKSYGVLFVEVMEAYSDSSASVASWIPAILSALCLALAPLTSALCQRFSCRTVVFVGGFFCALGLTISYFATRLIHLFFTFGVLTGIGGGLSTTPGIVMVAQYFDKHRALANGICVSGTAAGSFVFPVLIEHLCATFGFHGTLLVLGGCMLHVCISASLYRPIKPPSTSDDQKTNRKSASPQSALHQMQKTRTDAPLQLLFQTGVPLATVTSPHKLVLPAELFSQNAILIDPLNISDSDEEKDQIGETIFMKRISAFRSSSILHSVEDLSTDSTCVYKSRQREPLSRSMIVVSTADQVLTAARVQKENIITKDQLSDVPIEMKKRTLSQKISRYLDLSLLKDVSFIMMCLSVTLMSAGSPYMLYYLPAYCLSAGYTKTEAGYLVAISAALDLCGRLGLGWLSDLHLFDRRKGYIGSIVGAGVAVLVIPVADSFYVLACSVGMYGLCLGCWFLLVPVLLADKYGTDKISSSYGLVRMFQSFGAISVPPLAGYMRDVTGGYDICFYCMGTCMVLGGVPLLLVPDNFYSSDNGDEENNKTSSSSVVSAPRK